MLFELDLKMAEARIVDYMANERSMIDAYEKKLDPYRIVAMKIFNCSYEKVSKAPKSSGFSEKSQRAVAKEVKLGLAYGLGPEKFAERADLPSSIAKRLRNTYLAEICPNLRRVYWPYCEAELRNRKALTDLFGKTYKFYGLWGDDLLHRAYNFIPQSTVGRIINDWGLLYIWQKEALRQIVQILIQEHDSVKYQLRDKSSISTMTDILLEIIANLEQPVRFSNPYLKINGAPYECEFIIPVEAAAGYNFAKFDSDENPDGLRELDLGANLEAQLEEIKKNHYTLKERER